VRVVIAAALVALFACLAVAQSEGEPARLPDGVRIDRLVVDKSDHRMKAFRRGELIQEYEVAIGQGGLGPKRWEGDLTTPEGEYRIDRRHRSRQFLRFLHVSYPNREDRRRYRRLSREGAVPEGAGIGSAIGVHGQPQLAPGGLVGVLGLNWTAGCIAVRDREILDLYRAVVPNARIEIAP
jgi:murein L,D-transpeptidase YafK